MTAPKGGPARDPFDRDCDCVAQRPTEPPVCRHRVTAPMPEWPERSWVDLGLRQAEAWAQPIPPEILRSGR